MAVLRYTLLRAFVFAVVAALLWLLQMRGFMLVLVALLVSGLISLFALRSSRNEVSLAWDRRLAAIKERAAAEDAWDDERRAQAAAEAQRADAERPVDADHPADANREQ